MNDNELPYVDTKTHGAPDFYFGINATFRFIIRRFGLSGWKEYLDSMAADYYRPVWERWRAGGLPAVAAYLRQSFAAEPAAVTEVSEDSGQVVLRVQECPAIRHLRLHKREIVPEYCEHCYYQGQAMASRAGLAMRLQGGNGSCVHTYYNAAEAVPAQNMNQIRRVS